MAKNPKEDLFAESTMTFGEHLEELRVRLAKALIGVVMGIAIGLFVADWVVERIQDPLKAALTDFYSIKEMEEFKEKGVAIDTESARALIEEEGMIADMMNIELDQLILRLKEASPDQLGVIQYLPYSFVSTDFAPADSPAETVEPYQPFFAQIQAQSATADSRGGAVLSYLDDQQQSIVTSLASEENNSTMQDALGIMNALANDPTLVDGALKPHLDAVTDAMSDLEASQRVKDSVQQMQDHIENETSDEQKSSLTRRLNRFVLCRIFPEYLRTPRPATIEIPVWKKIDIKVQTLNAHEAFMIWLKAAVIAGFVVASPWVFFQLWAFVAAGLYPHERRYVYIYLPFSTILFLGGACVAFFLVMHPVLDFLFSYNRMMKIDPDPRISEWLGFVLFLPVGFGIAFQLPLVMLMLNRIGILTIEAYLSKWRVAVLVIFVAAMLLTPADPVSMLMLAVPLTALYFLGILLCKWMPRTKNPYEEGYDPD